ncbi:hypothetical protein CYMTET_28134 [Cymbomonas tetramitiformis]|uniref:Uncharacterized protein n=1 Tax=Cymbomonas tetramitiformis TaxID=36881 RepID=A0AAE0KW83_9CHLO|nr:hypothetical protein CYMTET_28134 [Cymbomonas tetramitiformis]|eukprot:gene2737-3515_t
MVCVGLTCALQRPTRPQAFKQRDLAVHRIQANPSSSLHKICTQNERIQTRKQRTKVITRCSESDESIGESDESVGESLAKQATKQAELLTEREMFARAEEAAEYAQQQRMYADKLDIEYEETKGFAQQETDIERIRLGERAAAVAKLDAEDRRKWSVEVRETAKALKKKAEDAKKSREWRENNKAEQ